MLFKLLKKIKKNREFSYIYKKGKRSYFEHVRIFQIKTREPGAFYGITTSKKFKSAVDRNKARRRTRNILKDESFAEKIKFVISIKETALEIPYGDLKEEILQALLKSKIILKDSHQRTEQRQ
ncbi:MAG: ribonuclease P protein component [Armatimonadota bacterium]